MCGTGLPARTKTIKADRSSSEDAIGGGSDGDSGLRRTRVAAFVAPIGEEFGAGQSVVNATKVVFVYFVILGVLYVEYVLYKIYISVYNKV